jgi:hypothetical protein
MSPASVIGIVALGVLLAYFAGSKYAGGGVTGVSHGVSGAHDPLPPVLETIRTVSWNSESLETILASRLPVRITGAPLPRWTWADIAFQEGGTLRSVMSSPQHRFYYYYLRAALGGSLRLRYDVIPTMDVSTFQRLVNTEGPPYYYYSAALNMTSDAPNPFNIAPFDVLNATRTPRADQVPNVRANIWIASANATSPLHYDGSHNLFAQLRGRKRFLLLPPTQFGQVSLNSVHHPCHRASGDPHVIETLLSMEHLVVRRYHSRLMQSDSDNFWFPAGRR